MIKLRDALLQGESGSSRKEALKEKETALKKIVESYAKVTSIDLYMDTLVTFYNEF